MSFLDAVDDGYQNMAPKRSGRHILTPEERAQLLHNPLVVPLDALPPAPLTENPFILSALKRFRLGPLSPLSLTRSQRAQVDLMVRGGWLEVTGDSMLQLTGKGRGAIQVAEDIEPSGVDERFP